MDDDARSYNWSPYRTLAGLSKNYFVVDCDCGRIWGGGGFRGYHLIQQDCIFYIKNWTFMNLSHVHTHAIFFLLIPNEWYIQKKFFLIFGKFLINYSNNNNSSCNFFAHLQMSIKGGVFVPSDLSLFFKYKHPNDCLINFYKSWN